MKTQLHRAWLHPGSSIVSLTVAFAFASAWVQATTLTLIPDAQNVGVGNSFDLAVRISGLGDHTAPSLGAFDLDLLFNPALVQFDSLSLGDPALGNLLGPSAGSIEGFALNGPGDAVNLFSVSLDAAADLSAAQPDHFTLASLHFTALALGSGNFSFANVVLGDAEGNPLGLNEATEAVVNINPLGLPETLPWWTAALAFGSIALGHQQLTRRSVVS